VTQVRSYVSAPRRGHYQALKRIVRYLTGTLDYGLLYSKDDAQGDVVVFVDSDWGGAVDRRSVSGIAVMFMGAAISWTSKKQTGHSTKKGEEHKKVASDIARSSAEAELRALDIAGREALWLRMLCMAFRLPGAETIRILEDNEACYNIAKGSMWSGASKHIDIQFKAINSDIRDERIDLKPVASADNISDIFTKPLQRVLFQRFREALGCVDVSRI
jgi:hypothetical protein